MEPFSKSNASTGDEGVSSEPQHFGSAFPQGIATECTTCCVFKF